MPTEIFLPYSDLVAVRWNCFFVFYLGFGLTRKRFSGLGRFACQRKLFWRIRSGLRFDGIDFLRVRVELTSNEFCGSDRVTSLRKLFCREWIVLRFNWFLCQVLVGFQIDFKWSYHVRVGFHVIGNNFVLFGLGCGSRIFFFFFGFGLNCGSTKITLSCSNEVTVQWIFFVRFVLDCVSTEIIYVLFVSSCCSMIYFALFRDRWLQMTFSDLCQVSCRWK